MANVKAAQQPQKTVDSIGEPKSNISVELSTRFLEHFSEQLYSSPQKAFEELISNGWDAGADYVDVRVAENLADTGATLSVLDNGTSMDAEGLRQLWHIASSPKKDMTTLHGRPVIGKFGIGKLSTYVLANKLTYICKASDGVIRRVTMDYSSLDQKDAADSNKLIRDLQLKIYEVSLEDVYEALKSTSHGKELQAVIAGGLVSPSSPVADREFGADRPALQRTTNGTWTLALLSDLKQSGRELKVGMLRRMLASALPIGSDMTIALNDEILESSKISTELAQEWVIGPDLKIEELSIEDESADASTANSPSVPPPVKSSKAAAGQKPVPAVPISKATTVKVVSGSTPQPYVELPDVGRVTGRVKLYKERITGGKSEERGSSNGFHINVLGRVVNQMDPSFGEENLSHAVWASFRMTVRADGLNHLLTTNREQFKETRQLKIFRAFLRKAFNVARSQYDSDQSASLPDGGDVLVQSLGVLSLSPLRNVVSEALNGNSAIPGLFDDTGVKDKAAKRKSWREETSDNIKNALNEVKYERLGDDSFAKFRIEDSSIVVNKEHPFVEEHSRTRAEKELVRTIAMVNLLCDVYALDIGVQTSKVVSVRQYRDKLMRIRAIQRRKSGMYIAKLLLQMQHDSDHSKRLEVVVSDALRHLGFQVKDLAKSGEPEGIASAFPTPTLASPTEDDPNPPLYSFSFDAKASKHENAKTGNIKLDGVVEHRNRYKANYALVVAPGFQDGALATRCAEQQVTPITARDLGRLLEFTVEHGAIPVTKLREIFSLFDPAKVSNWIDELKLWLVGSRSLTLDIFLKALKRLRGQIPDVLSASTIALECRRALKATKVKEEDVVALVKGLQILIPNLVGIENDKIVVNASAERVAAAVQAQLESLADASSELAESTSEDDSENP